MGATAPEEGESIGMASPSLRSDTSLFGEGIRARIAWESGTALLETPRSLLLGFRGIYSVPLRVANRAFLGA